MITVIGDRDDVAAGDSGYRGFWFDLPDDATLGQAVLSLFDERCMPRMAAPWVVNLLADPVTVKRDDQGRVQYIPYGWTGETVGVVVDESFVLTQRQWTLSTPLAATGHRLSTGDFAFYLSYVGQGRLLDVDALRAAARSRP